MGGSTTPKRVVPCFEVRYEFEERVINEQVLLELATCPASMHCF